MIDKIPLGAKPASPTGKYIDRDFCPVCRMYYPVETNVWGDVLVDDHAKCKQILRQKAYSEEMLKQLMHKIKDDVAKVLIGVLGAVFGAILAIILKG